MAVLRQETLVLRTLCHPPVPRKDSFHGMRADLPTKPLNRSVATTTVPMAAPPQGPKEDASCVVSKKSSELAKGQRCS